MEPTRNAVAVALLLAAVAPQLSAQQAGSLGNLQAENRRGPGERLVCPVDAVHDTGTLPKFANVYVNDGVVLLNDRPTPTSVLFYAPPEHKIFVLTDIVVQNRASGDEPVGATQFSSIAISSPTGGDLFFSVVGNNTFSQHFNTGILESSLFRFYNIGNSSAPFVEVLITGVLRDCVNRQH